MELPPTLGEGGVDGGSDRFCVHIGEACLVEEACQGTDVTPTARCCASEKPGEPLDEPRGRLLCGEGGSGGLSRRVFLGSRCLSRGFARE